MAEWAGLLFSYILSRSISSEIIPRTGWHGGLEVFGNYNNAILCDRSVFYECRGWKSLSCLVSHVTVMTDRHHRSNMAVHLPLHTSCQDEEDVLNNHNLTHTHTDMYVENLVLSILCSFCIHCNGKVRVCVSVCLLLDNSSGVDWQKINNFG